jgi:hypothetical protein
MSIASDAPAAHTPSVTQSALLRRKIRGRCVRSSVSSAAGSYGKRRKVSIIIRLRRHATSSAGEHESRSERTSRDYQEILRVEAATPRTARSGGVFGMLHRTTVRPADLIEGIVDSRPYKIRGHQKRNARTSGPFLRFSESYCFGSGSDAKFAWTNIHLSPFFTKTRVDFARFGVVFPSLSCVRPA